MEWSINRFLQDKWIRYYENTKKARRLYVSTSLIGSIVGIIFILYILPFIIFNIKIETLVDILLYSAFVIFVIIWELNMWIVGDYIRFSWQPIKVKISKNGLEIINLFGKYRLLKWENILKINFSEGQKIYVAVIRPNSKFPPIIAPRKINIFLDLEIGSKVLEQWKLYLSKNGHRQDIKRGGHKNE